MRIYRAVCAKVGSSANYSEMSRPYVQYLSVHLIDYSNMPISDS